MPILMQWHTEANSSTFQFKDAINVIKSYGMMR
jgi:hypothetical protein